MNALRSFINRGRNYIFDTGIDIKDRSFMLFSVLTLLALYIAVPFGLVMKEPVFSTVSTLFGALIFTFYVIFVYKTNRISRARIVLSVVVIAVFLPAMFFTNGGAEGGAPLWLLLGTVYIGLILEGRLRAIMLIINVVVLTLCWIIAYNFPDIVMEYSRGQNYFDSMAGLIIVGAIEYVLISFYVSLFKKDEESNNLRRLFEQTATALVNAIDAKDAYTHGHSARVAEYSRKIAELSGKNPRECDEIYHIALLHDVGKIGIAENIINKEGKLTEEEYEAIKQHPVLGSQILKSINEYPDLIIGARFHHERYDGRGYPDKLKGEDIPEIARIISVADAYDAMTSRRSYRDPIPQTSVREEIVKGSGSQFDPKFAKIMQHLIDLDTEYEMREKGSVKELSGKNKLKSENFRDEISDGILLGPDPYMKNIRLKCRSLDESRGEAMPSMILFDSLDGRYHSHSQTISELNYFEYAEIRFDGSYEIKGARKIETEKGDSIRIAKSPEKSGRVSYDIEAVKVKDHVKIRIDDGQGSTTLIIALPDSARYVYIGLTGENSLIYDVEIDTFEKPVPKDYIRRIAEEISYINVPAGDIPNVQMDGYRTDSSEAIPVRDGMKISFHTLSLPTARLVWHCPYVDLFYSPDKVPSGEGYREYALIRLDGENWEAENIAENKLIVNIKDDFMGWDAWKDANKKGYDCSFSFKREENRIITTTENHGISLTVITTVLDDPPEIYATLTGDQCALTNIRITNDNEGESD